MWPGVSVNCCRSPLTRRWSKMSLSTRGNRFTKPNVSDRSCVGSAAGIDSGIVSVIVDRKQPSVRSEEHTSELQSLMRISYAVFCLKKKNHHKDNRKNTDIQKSPTT